MAAGSMFITWPPVLRVLNRFKGFNAACRHPVKCVALGPKLDSAEGAERSARSLKDILYRKRMERQLLQARGLAAGPERPPDEDDVRGAPLAISDQSQFDHECYNP